MVRFGLLVAVVVALAVLAMACQDNGGGSADEPEEPLAIGDCLLYETSGEVRPVYCFDTHHAEVIEIVNMPDGPYPGDAGINRFAIDNCPDATDTFIYPTADTWAVGDRAVSCLEEDLEVQP